MTGERPDEGPLPLAHQVVTATAGFAYGVIGADIHVLGDGTPLYLLLNWAGTSPADREWLRQLPSRMLNARFAVVTFSGREEELGELQRWRDGGPRLAIKWLYGQGGQGKSRLAAEFMGESSTAGWKVVVAARGPGAVLPPPGSQDMSTDGAAGVLLVIDYADHWPVRHLAWLLSNALFHQTGLDCRILMLARATGSWPACPGRGRRSSGGYVEPVPAAHTGGFRRPLGGIRVGTGQFRRHL